MRRTGLSRSQFLRYKKRYRALGPRGLIHAGRGRVSGRRLAEEVRQRLHELLADEVALNDCHIRDLLEGEGISVSAESVRRVRREGGQPPKQRRRPRKYRQRRERQAQEGAMVLVDGSPFRWLGPQQSECTLVGAMDDATGKVLALVFRDHEDLHGFTTLLRDTIRSWGVPWTLYGDRGAVLVRNDRHWTIEEDLQGRQSPSQFGRMLEALGIRYIAALSPQAKGRIERLWRTLQDRLAAELALQRCVSREQAQACLPAFLQRYNQRFARPARETQLAWRKAPRELDRLLGCRYSRVVRLDNTVTLGGECLQLPPGQGGRSFAHCRVELRELLDGRCLVFHQERLVLERPTGGTLFELVPRGGPRPNSNLPVRRAVARHPRPAPRPLGSPAYLASIKPGPDHPFRRSYKALRRKEDPKGVSLSRRS